MNNKYYIGCAAAKRRNGDKYEKNIKQLTSILLICIITLLMIPSLTACNVVGRCDLCNDFNLGLRRADLYALDGSDLTLTRRVCGDCYSDLSSMGLIAERFGGSIPWWGWLLIIGGVITLFQIIYRVGIRKEKLSDVIDDL